MSLVELFTHTREADSFPKSGPFAIRPVVLDANVLAADVYHTVFHGRSALLDTATFGTGRLFTAKHIWAKVYRVLRDMAHDARAGMLPKAVAVWETKYLPLVRFVDMDDCPVDDHRVVTVGLRDPEDEPLARLAALLAPCTLMSWDRHMRGLGMAGENWLPLALAGRDAMLPTQATMVATVPVNALVMGVEASYGLLRDRPSWRVPAAMIGLGVIGLIVWLVWTADRRSWRESLGAFVSDASERLRPVVERYNDARELLERGTVTPLTDADAQARVARTLATAPRALLMREISDALASEIDPLTMKPREVGRLLRASSCFFRFNDATWQLGFLARPRQPLLLT